MTSGGVPSNRDERWRERAEDFHHMPLALAAERTPRPVGVGRRGVVSVPVEQTIDAPVDTREPRAYPRHSRSNGFLTRPARRGSLKP